MHKLSATVITYNEEERIRNCLESISWADEIVVVDSGSTDRTVDICREYTERISINEWPGYGKQKNFCAQQAANNWILNVDADEVVSYELQMEIKRLLSARPEYNAYKIPRKNYVKNIWIRHGGWYPDYIARVYNKDRYKFSDAFVHESIVIDGSCGKLYGHLEHYTYKDIDDYFKRIDKYSTLSAYEMDRKNKKFHWYDVILHPPFNFIKNYLLKMGFLDGCCGLILAGGYSLYTFKKYSKLRKINKR